jgi:hypothetical protein
MKCGDSRPRRRSIQRPSCSLYRSHGLANRQAGEQGQQDGEESDRSVHQGRPDNPPTISSQRPCARSTSSI